MTYPDFKATKPAIDAHTDDENTKYVPMNMKKQLFTLETGTFEATDAEQVTQISTVQRKDTASFAHPTF